MGDLTTESRQLIELWRSQYELQFRQLHAIGNCKFVLSGGLYFPSLPQNNQCCATSLLCAESSQIIWESVYSNHQIFTCSCVTNSHVHAGIPFRYKSEFSGIMRFNLVDGELLEQSREFQGLSGIVSLKEDDFAYAVYEHEKSELVVEQKGRRNATEISNDKFLKIRSLRADSNERVILTMQRVLSKNASGKIQFVHQMRRIDGTCMWEYDSNKDSAIIGQEGTVFLYNDASDKRTTSIEILDSESGEVKKVVRIGSSIADLLAITPSLLVYCSQKYELCVYDIEKGRILQAIPFPNKTPGWLTFAWDADAKILLACKADNFMSPKSTVAAFKLV